MNVWNWPTVACCGHLSFGPVADLRFGPKETLTKETVLSKRAANDLTQRSSASTEHRNDRSICRSSRPRAGCPRVL